MAGLRISHLWRAGQMICVVVVLLGVLSVLGSCATHQPSSTMPDDDSFAAQALDDDDSFAARPLDDDDSLADKAGEVGIVGVMVGVIVGGILLPIFAL